ncbi:MAG: hypothetical protein PHE03_06120 [Bacteroidales bacterium]|nr:hypothetical protein [Bacteroidales bacterium]MDD3891864.1 hypothetical protein [Bacteroidales bacterium]
MAFFKLLLIVLLILAVVFLMFGVKIFFHKSHKFPETSAGQNPEMKKRGITCATHNEKMLWSKNEGNAGCGTCCGHSKKLAEQ